MNKKTQEYWRKRVEKEMEWSERRDRNLDEELRLLYLRHLKEIDKEIQAFYQRYAENNKVSMREAKKRVSEMDVQAFADKAAQYVKEKNFSPQANEELAVYNLAMKVSRLEMLQYHIDLQMVALGDEEQKLTETYLQENYQSGVRSQAGILGESVIRDFKTNKTLMDTVINMSFHGVTWKSASKERQQALRQVMSNVVERSVLRGENPIKFLNEIQKTMDSSRYAARRLAITEGTKAATMTQMAMLRQSEYDHYEVICERSACDICKPFDEKPQPLDGQLIGTNAPPFHPHCKCSICASVPDVDKPRKELYNYREVDDSLLEKLKQMSIQWFEGLTNKEKTAVRDITTSKYHSSLNRMLYDDTFIPENSKELTNMVDQLDSAFEKFTLEDSIIAYRGVSPKELLNIIEGDIFKEYKHVSVAEEVGQSFAKINRGVVVKFYIPKDVVGAYVAPNSKFQNEKELILGRDTNYSVKKTDDGQLEVYIHGKQKR